VTSLASKPADAVIDEASDLVTGPAWVLEPRGIGWLARMVEIWQYRRLISFFAIDSIQRTYRATLLGWGWLLIRPIFPVIVGTLIFHSLIGVASPGKAPYFLFYLVGHSIFEFFEDCLIRNTRSLQMNKKILTKLYFPRIILPAATMAPGVVTLCIHLGLIVLATVYFAIADGQVYLTLGIETLCAVAAVIMSMMLSFGLGLFTSVLGSEVRDVRFTLRYILRFWYFLTPVFYPLSAVPEKWRLLASLNPMTTIVELFKYGLLREGDGVVIEHVAVTAAVLSVLLIAGLAFFWHAEATSIDRL